MPTNIVRTANAIRDAERTLHARGYTTERLGDRLAVTGGDRLSPGRIKALLLDHEEPSDVYKLKGSRTVHVIPRPERREEPKDPNPSELEEAMRMSMQRGYVLTADGRRVEPDHPDSPLRIAGII